MDEQFVFDIAQPYDLFDLIACVQDTFPEHEPMSRALRLKREDYLPYSDLVCKKAVDERMTIVIRSHRTTKLVGFCINEDFASALEYSKARISPKMQPLLALLEDFDRRHLGDQLPPKKKVFHLYMLGVLPEFANYGLGKELVNRSLQMAKEKGFAQAVVEATGPVSQKICRKVPFVERQAVAYESFRYRGEPVFRNIEGVTHCHLMDRAI